MSFDLIIAAKDPRADTLRLRAQQFALRDPTGKTIIPLILEELLPATPWEIAERAGEFAALADTAGLCYFRARVHAAGRPAAAAPRRFLLFDLMAGNSVERSRAVAILYGQGTRLNLAFASDLHVARLWDEIAEAVLRYSPELARTLVHPHVLLDRFVSEANSLAARGELDLVVLGGDLVDQVQSYPRASRSNGNGTNNVSRLLALLARLEVPTLVVPGNHDYRHFPRRPRASGLENVGISREQCKSLLRKAGLWDRWKPFSRRDIDALRVTDAAGMPALNHYLTHVAPVTEYRCLVRGLRLMFVSTGCDVVVKWREVERARWGLLLRGLRTARRHPDSEGFSEIQLMRIRAWLQEGGGASLFFHAPLFSARGEVCIEECHSRIGTEPQGSLAARVRFERRMHQAGFRCGVSFRNPGALLQELAGAPGPVATFSGHLHWAGAMEINRRTMQIRSLTLNQVGSRLDAIPLLTAPALGQVKPEVGQRPGFLLAQFLDGTLVSVEQRTLHHGQISPLRSPG